MTLTVALTTGQHYRAACDVLYRTVHSLLKTCESYLPWKTRFGLYNLTVWFGSNSLAQTTWVYLLWFTLTRKIRFEVSLGSVPLSSPVIVLVGLITI